MHQLSPEDILVNSRRFNIIVTITLLGAVVIGFALGFFTGFLLR